MVYKKYIRKEGKLYGPYIYSSKRVGEKVISEYLGPDKRDKKRLMPLIIICLIGIISIFLIFTIGNKATGNIILDKNSENSSEYITLSLKKGELIPSSTKVILENSNGINEYVLKDLIVEEKTTQGNYYLEGQEISKKGEGYGIAGEKTVYPKVDFTLVLRKKEETKENLTEDESKVEEPTLENLEENPITQQQDQEPDKGRIIPEILDSVSNFFLGLLPTARVIDSAELIELNEKVSYENPFNYELKEGEQIELLSGSVKSGDKSLEDQILVISKEGNSIIINTDYSEIEEGFGEEYLEDETNKFYLKLPENYSKDLENLKLVYEDLELADLTSGSHTQEIIEIPTPEDNEEPDPELIEDLIQENNTQQEFYNLSLTSTEKNMLSSLFGNALIEVSASKNFNGRYILNYEFDDYRIEYSYDSNLDSSLLKSQIERDKIKWIRDILAKEQESASKIQEVPSEIIASAENNSLF